MRVVIGDVAVVTTGHEPTVTRVWRLAEDGRVGACLAEFYTYGQAEGSSQHARAVRAVKRGEYEGHAVRGAA